MAHFGLEFKISEERYLATEVSGLISASAEFKLIRQTYLDSAGNLTNQPEKISDFFYSRLDFFRLDSRESMTIEIFYPASNRPQELIGRLYFDHYNPVELIPETSPPATRQDLINLIKEVLIKAGATNLQELKLNSRYGAEVIPFPRR